MPVVKFIMALKLGFPNHSSKSVALVLAAFFVHLRRDGLPFFRDAFMTIGRLCARFDA